MRLFIGLALDEQLRKRVADYAATLERLAPLARWVRRESYHLTLKFLGECRPEQRVVIETKLKQVHSPPVELALRGVGFFPSPSRAQVFWVGVGADERLIQLAAAIQNVMTALGFEPERKPYRPHLTLARAPGGRGAAGESPARGRRGNNCFARVREELSGSPAPDFGTMQAREFFLYQSTTGAGGAVYSKLAAFPLSGS